MDNPGVTDVITIGGYSLLDSLQSSNGGAAIAVLENWSQRPDPELHANAITAKLLRIEEGTAFAFIPPPIQGLGNAGGGRAHSKTAAPRACSSSKRSWMISPSREIKIRY